MKKPSQELIDAFFNWYQNNSHSENEDYYRETITKDYLSGLNKSDFINFFYTFAHEGGRLQSGGPRTSSKFRQTIEDNYDRFHSFVLNPFDLDFDIEKWLAKMGTFKYFGIGLATIFLNRVDKKKFPIINNKTADSLELFDISLPGDTVKRYQAVLEAQRQIIDWYPLFDNFYRTDALNQFLIGEKEGQPWKKILENENGQENILRYWVYAPGPNAKFWDECYENNIMLYGADELKNLLTYENKNVIEDTLKKKLGLKGRPTNDALAAWNFSRVVKPGDIIIAKKGRQHYIGYGIVTGNYNYNKNRDTYRNSRTIEWKKKANGPRLVDRSY